jgi:ethanolamine transporter EutH
MALLRLGFTAAVMTGVVWLLMTGKPLGGLLFLPLVAIWLRRKAESGELTRWVTRGRST